MRRGSSGGVAIRGTRIDGVAVTFAGNAYLKGVRTQGVINLKKQW